ncbi:MAG: hypothetical protein MRJ67_04675 [Nitrospirales bacterium]|nr:hypothetical protein [Nitrospirales bacterium]
MKQVGQQLCNKGDPEQHIQQYFRSKIGPPSSHSDIHIVDFLGIRLSGQCQPFRHHYGHGQMSTSGQHG